MKWVVRILLGIAGIVGCLLIAGLALGTSERTLPEKLVGFYQTTLDVPHRNAALPVFVWYPAESDAAAELIGQNALFYGFHAQRDAAADQTPAPVVVLSHGSGGNALSLGWLATELAARGMIVVATNHPGTTSRDSFPDATVRVWERQDDLKALLDYASSDLPHGLTSDMDRVGALGFSLGGFSVLGLGGAEVSKERFIDYCTRYPDKLDCGWMNANGLDFDAIDAVRYEQSNRDPRVKAIVAVDPALPLALKEGGLTAVTADTLVVQLGETETIAEGMRWGTAVPRIANGSFYQTPNTYHFAFLAECSTLGKIIIATAGDDNICADKGTRDRGEVHTELRTIIGDFLTKSLIAPNVSGTLDAQSKSP